MKGWKIRGCANTFSSHCMCAQYWTKERLKLKTTGEEYDKSHFLFLQESILKIRYVVVDRTHS